MPWIILLISAVFEAVWATALGKSDGFSQPVPTIVFLIALAFSMVGLGIATKKIPIGTAYAIWVAIGAVLTIAYAMGTGDETVTVPKLIAIAGIIIAVVGLKLLPSRPAAHPEPVDEKS